MLDCIFTNKLSLDHTLFIGVSKTSAAAAAADLTLG